MFLKCFPPICTVLLALSGPACNCLQASAICVNVKDFADQPLPGARATIVNLGTSAVTVIRTGEGGSACTPQIPEGLYSVEVGLSGFLNVRYYPIRLSFPGRPDLQFRLPFGEVTEGGIREDAVVSGTLKDRSGPVGRGEICLLEAAKGTEISCTTTNELGEYALSVPPGEYGVELKRDGKLVQGSSIQLRSPGVYRDIITLGAQNGKH